jgi:hypothetical protein
MNALPFGDPTGTIKLASSRPPQDVGWNSYMTGRKVESSKRSDARQRRPLTLELSYIADTTDTPASSSIRGLERHTNGGPLTSRASARVKKMVASKSLNAMLYRI